MEITTYDMFMEGLYKEFPDVDKRSIRSVCRHGLVMLSKFRRMNHDIYLNNNREDLYYYFGFVTKDEQKRFAISNYKAPKKLRLMYNLTKTKYSGYYYFVLDDEQYKQHLRGEPFDRLFLYKVLKEAKLYKKGTHTFQYKMDKDWWFKIETNFHTANAEEI